MGDELKRLILLHILFSFLVIVSGCETEKSSEDSGVNSNLNTDKNNYTKIVSPNNQLGFALLAEIEADDNGNTFISPTSLMMALSMVYNGADGVTKKEMAKVLRADGIDVGGLNKANASLISTLQRESKQIQLDIANSIWINNNYHFKEEFARNNQDYFHAKIQEIDIHDNKSSEMINDWVKEATKDKIDKIVDSPLNSDLVAILINAIYFNGNWKYELDKEQTEQRPFYLEDGTTKNISLMKLKKKIQYLENEDFQAVSLPYGDDEMSMKVFLPKDNVQINGFRKILTDDNWKKWSSEFQEKEGTILLPKFQLEYEIKLNSVLEKLGMKTAFDSENANFKKMITEEVPLWIDMVKQKTFIEVNEEGTEAAAVTSAEMVTESFSTDSFQMEINRPFFFVITDEKSGTILFMGVISNPQESK